ncbi:unnamed protein product [Callosobruchus maculatus]|uniref:Uncharacterized protein n=1 Tax=Callosobruchus maculatus TaxID=64391 RepID=A0A653DKL2_CALMS|nr:unnamed protein product [Callosobruchus maculatus]
MVDIIEVLLLKRRSVRQRTSPFRNVLATMYQNRHELPCIDRNLNF